MLVRLLSGQDITVSVDDQDKVKTVKRKILASLNKTKDSISLLNNGAILDDESTLHSCQLNDSSVITAVITPSPPQLTIEQQEKQVEEYLVAMCRKHAGLPAKEVPTLTKKEDQSLRVFTEITDEASKFIFPWTVEELWERYFANNVFVENWIQHPFFQAVIADTAAVRGCLLSHPLIAKLIELNPDLSSFIQNDDNIRMVIDTFIQNRQFFTPEGRKAGKAQLEKELGHPLQLAPEHIAFIKQFTKQAEENKRLVKKQQLETAKRKTFTKEQLKAASSLMKSHPEIAIRYVKMTPIYRLLIQKNPNLLKRILSSERLQVMFSPQSLQCIANLGHDAKFITKERKKEN